MEVYLALLDVYEEMRDSWAVAKTYENIVECLWLKFREGIDVKSMLEICDKAIEGFASANGLNTLFVTMENIARLAY